MDYFFQEQRWTDTFLSLHVKKVKRIILFLLIAFSATGTKAQSDVTFNDYVRYSQWVIDSRLGDFYGNTNNFGFTTYKRNLSVNQEVTKWKSGTKDPYIDYVAGLVAKATIEAAEYYKDFTWAKPWFKSVEWYGNKCTVSTTPDNLDAINASKMYFGIYNLANSTNGAFKDKAEAGTVKKATDQLGNALTALKYYNNKYAFDAGTILNGKDIAGGWYHKSTYPKQMWLDGQYMGPALLAQLINGYSSYDENNKVSNNDWDLITKQFTIVWEQCWDSNEKLLYHAFSSEKLNYWTSDDEIWTTAQTDKTKWTQMTAAGHSPAFWGRAEGWYFLALVDVLEQMQLAGLNKSTNDNYSCYTTLKGYLDDLALGIAKRQDATSGCWYQLIGKNGEYSAQYYNGDDKGVTKNYLESSCTAIFAAAFLKATRLKLLSSVTVGTTTYNYKDIGTNAYKGAVTQFMKQRTDGTVDLLGCCKSAGVGTAVLGETKFRDGSNAYYLHGYDVTPTSTNSGDNYTEGKVLGAFIMAATEYERANEKDIRFSYDLAPSYTLAQGGSITAEALGSGTISYQWFNASDNSLVFDGQTFAPTKSGSYYCQATSGSTTIQTSKTTVTVSGTSNENVGSGTNKDIFSLTVTYNQEYSLDSDADLNLNPNYATVTGGSALVHNGKNQAAKIIYLKNGSSGNIALNGSSNSTYAKLTLYTPLQEGDVITFTSDESPIGSFYLTTTLPKNTNCPVNDGTYTVTSSDGLANSTELYVWSNSNGKFKSITITRDYPESDSRATFTYGSSQLTFTETPEGTYTTTLEIGASKKGETITITPSKQDGATIKKDGTTVSGDITITAPSKTGNTDTHTYTVTSKDGSSTTTYIINVKVVKEKITLKYSDSNGNTEWTWNSTTTPDMPTFNPPTVKAYIKNAEGKDELLTDASLSYTYESDVTSVATVDASSGKITIAKSGNGGAKIYATLKENENYYADPAFFNVLLEQGYSFSVNASETAPAINTSKYITRTTEGTKEKLVKMTFGGWKWEGYANADATTKTLGSYKVVRGDKTTYYTDKWNDSGEKASDIASIDGHYYSWNGVNDAVDESKAASDKAIYGSIRYGWFKSPVHDNDGKTTESYPYTLPVRGSFMTFEPTMNGTLTIYILQNGAWNTNNNGGTYEQVGDGSITYEKGDIIPGQFRPHAFQVVNQRGLTVQEFSPNYSVSTKQKVDSRYYCMFKGDEDYNETKYNNPYNVAKWTEFAKYMSTEEQKRAHDSWNSGPLGAQKIIELDNGSFLAVQKGIVKYTFHVTGNETYYFFSNFSKMGFSGANFVPDGSQPQETVSNKISTLELSDVTAYNKITATPKNSNIEGTELKDYTYTIGGKEIAPVAGVYIPQFYSIKLKRTFKPNQWTTLSLPFNLTQTEVEQIFGKGTQIIVFDKAKIISARTYLTFFYHEIQNVLPGYPYLIRPTLVDANDNQMETKSNSADKTPTYTITGGNLTEFTVYNKAINPFIEQHEFVYGDYTAKCTPSYCTANVLGNGRNDYSKQYENGDIFVSENNGTVYISGGQSYGKGYRSYIDYTGTTPPSAKALSISFSGVEDDDDNGTTTDIRIAELADDVIETLGIGGVYNLNGQKVADTTRNLPAGIYIVNGRKVVVK